MKTLAALAAEGCMASCPRTFADMAAYADRALGGGKLRSFVATAGGTPVVAFGGSVIAAEAALEDCEGPSAPPRSPRKRVDCLCLPVPLGPLERLYGDEGLRAQIARLHREGATIAAPCASAFLLASAGLLEGMQVPISPGLAERFAALFPGTRADTRSRLLDEGGLMVSVGAASAPELGVRVIGRLCGEGAAAAVARIFLDSDEAARIALGGRAVDFDDGPARAARCVEERYAEPLRLADLVCASGLEARTLARRFRKRYGRSPMDYVRLVRCSVAAELLASTDLSAAEIGWRVGYAEPASFARAFKAVFGSSPGSAR